MVVVVLAAFIDALLARRNAGAQLRFDHRDVAIGPPHRDAIGGGADVGAVHALADAGAHVAILGAAGIGAAVADGRAIHRMANCLGQRLVVIGTDLRMLGDHLLDGHGGSPCWVDEAEAGGIVPPICARHGLGGARCSVYVPRMTDLISLVSLLFLGLVAGTAAGWFFASRPLVDLRTRLSESERAAAEREGEFKRAIAELGQARVEVASLKERAGQVDGLLVRLDAALAGRAQLAEKLAALESASEEREKAFAEQRAGLLSAQESLKKEFENAGNRVLEQAQKAFLDRAEARFRQSEETGEAKIKALLSPVGEKLASYERQVAELEAKRTDAFGQLAGLIQSMKEGQEQVRREAQRLGNSLTNAPKARGRWGERALQNLLEQCGLAQHTDFIMEHSVSTEDGRLRPDAIVRIPGGKVLVIDSKVSLNAYQQAFEAVDDDARARALADHVRSMRNHVQTLGAKSYQSQFEDAPDYVVMFVPGEHFVAAALEADPDLWNFAFDKRVLLATPTNLVAIARTVAQVWRQDGLAKEAQEIGRMGAELYDRLAMAADHLKRVGGGLESAVNNYNKFVGSFERNVLSSGRRLAEKGIEIGKREIEEVPLVASAPRYNGEDVAALEAPDSEA